MLTFVSWELRSGSWGIGPCLRILDSDDAQELKGWLSQWELKGWLSQWDLLVGKILSCPLPCTCHTRMVIQLLGVENRSRKLHGLGMVHLDRDGEESSSHHTLVSLESQWVLIVSPQLHRVRSLVLLESLRGPSLHQPKLEFQMLPQKHHLAKLQLQALPPD